MMNVIMETVCYLGVKGKSKVHPYTGIEDLYRSYGP